MTTQHERDDYAAGGIYINDTTTRTGRFWKVRVVSTTRFDTGTSVNIDNFPNDGTISIFSNTEIIGNFESIQLFSGAVIAYKV